MFEPLDFILLIPCFNNPAGLRRSLASIVYDPKRYGILIVDDGSEQPVSMDMLSVDVPSVTVIIRHETNQGITAALNTGLCWLQQRNDYRFVARLDCGDICAVERFVRQVDFLTNHPEIDLLGAWVRFKDFSSGFSYAYKTPVEQRRIQRGMHFRNLFIHPSVMWRASVHARIGQYPCNLPHAEDYGFFYKIVGQGQTAILPEELVICEINQNGLSIQYRRQQLKSRMRAVLVHRTNNLLGLLGALKLQLMLFIPYKFVLMVKSLIS
jgi:glycosyltransferase involved in cell wall biosynthesis